HRELDAGELGSRRSFEADPLEAARAWRRALGDSLAAIAAALAPGAAAALVIGDSVVASGGGGPARAAYALDDVRGALPAALALEAWASQERPMLGVVERRAFGPRPKAEHVVLLRRR